MQSMGVESYVKQSNKLIKGTMKILRLENSTESATFSLGEKKEHY